MIYKIFSGGGATIQARVSAPVPDPSPSLVHFFPINLPHKIAFRAFKA